MEVTDTRLKLDRNDFREAERAVLESPAGSISLFKYPSGVEAVEINAGRSTITVLPFRGQQIWRYVVDGEDLTMKTTFAEPAASETFGESYGAFLVHCGLTGIGAPGEGDQHAHHGELPSISANEAFVVSGEADGEDFLGLVNNFEYRLSHGFAYRVRVELKVFPERTTIPLKLTVTNLRSEPLSYAYLCHLNWKLDGLSLLKQSVLKDPENFVLAPHPGQSKRTAELLQAFEKDFNRSDIIDASQEISPEYCAVLRPQETSSGQAEFMGLREDGSAFWVAFDPQALPRAVRWMSRTEDEQAAGFCLPSTGHHFGRTKNQQDGLLQVLPAGKSAEINIVFGKLSKAEAEEAAARIDESL